MGYCLGGAGTAGFIGGLDGPWRRLGKADQVSPNGQRVCRTRASQLGAFAAAGISLGLAWGEGGALQPLPEGAGGPLRPPHRPGVDV